MYRSANKVQYSVLLAEFNCCNVELDWIMQCFTSTPTQYRLYGRRFLQVKRPNQQYQSTEGNATKENKKAQLTLSNPCDVKKHVKIVPIRRVSFHFTEFHFPKLPMHSFTQ